MRQGRQRSTQVAAVLPQPTHHTLQPQWNEGNDKISVEINKTETKKTVEKINQGVPW